MPNTVAVQSVLTQAEFDRLCKISDDIELPVPLSCVVQVAGENPQNIARVIHEHQKQLIIYNVLLSITNGVFYNPDGGFHTAQVVASPDTFKTVAQAFADVAAYQLPESIVTAKLLTAIVNRGGATVIDQTTIDTSIVPHILMDPHTIGSPEQQHFPSDHDKRQMATKVFDDLIKSVFGIETRPYTPGQTQDKKKHPFLTPEILERAVQVVGHIDTPDHHRQRMIRFLNGCGKARSDIFHTDRLRQAFQDQMTPLGRLAHKAEVISGELYGVSPKFTR